MSETTRQNGNVTRNGDGGTVAGIPPLAGLCTYEEAAAAGYSVEENVARLVRYAWIQKRLMECGLYWINPTPEWEVKEALSLHLYLEADHAGMIRKRVSEMRNPPPNMDKSPDDRLDTFFREMLTATDTLEKIVGLYGVIMPALLDALKRHYETTNPLVDHPTRRILRIMIDELGDAVSWGEAALAVLTADADAKARADSWQTHLRAFLQGAAGVMGDEPLPDTLPKSRVTGAFEPDFFPQRDERFEMRWNFFFPCHQVARNEEVPEDERTLALMCKRALEIDVPEAMARMIAVAENEPWEYYMDMGRQLWDEARHAMMGTIYFANHNVDWKKEVALHPGFSLRMNLELSPEEAHLGLYVIEQSLMNAKTGKKAEWQTAVTAKNDMAVLFQDYDWADEVLHAQIGRRWILPKFDHMSPNEVMEYGRTLILNYGKTYATYRDRGEQFNWWPSFVKRVLGKESGMKTYATTVFTSG